MTSKTASQGELELLHAQLATTLSKAIDELEPKIVELPDAEAEGGKKKTVVMVRNAAVLNVARQFLKDNNIQAELAKSPAGRKLLEGLTRIPEDELNGPAPIRY